MNDKKQNNTNINDDIEIHQDDRFETIDSGDSAVADVFVEDEKQKRKEQRRKRKEEKKKRKEEKRNEIKMKKKLRSKRAQSGTVQVLSLLMMCAVVISFVFAWMVWSIQYTFDQPGPLKQETVFIVEKGDTFVSILFELQNQQIIKEQGFFKPFIRGVVNAGKAADLKVGEFAIKPHMSMREVMELFTSGTPIEYAITIPEGWTSFNVIEKLKEIEFLSGAVPLDVPEGSLLADTYNFQRGTPRQDVIQRMQKAQMEFVKKMWETKKQNLPYKSPMEMLILASIVEKETAVASERPKVASVFVNRLRRGMKLQTDPTVIYGIWGGQGKPKDRGGLRQSELARETPYNTYQIDGLPPTPIANVGQESLTAVAQPDETDYLFFVADGNGGHAFAETLEEHNRNVAKWREIEKNQNNTNTDGQN